MLATLAKLDKKTAFIGKVGNDQFGHFLQSVLKDNRIETKGLVFSETVRTTLAFVHLSDEGDRSFSFYRNPGADMTLDINEIDLDIIKHSYIFHFGSLSMTHEPAATATLETANFAKNNGCIVSYDPNFRMALWNSSEDAKKRLVKDYPMQMY